MKAIAIYPKQPNSLHLENIPEPSVNDIPNGRGVKVQVIRVGVDGTDKEIIEGLYGAAPEGCNYLITGHENLGKVVEVGSSVPESIRPGMYAAATVRRPGHSIYDQIGMQDMTTDDVYYERGINLLHGYLTEYYIEDYTFIVTLPDSLVNTGVILEPLTIAEKGINQAFEIQRRLKVWQPQRALVTGAGTVGLLTALVMRLRGLEVVCYSHRLPPYYNSDRVGELGAHYISVQQMSLSDVSAQYGPFDLIFEATGYSPMVFEAAEVLGKNGVLVLSSVTGGDTQATIHSDKINQGFVLGNKVMVGTVNASKDDFERGVNDLILADARFPGWIEKLLTTRINGLENYDEMHQHLLTDKEAIKVYVQVAEE